MFNVQKPRKIESFNKTIVCTVYNTHNFQILNAQRYMISGENTGNHIYILMLGYIIHSVSLKLQQKTLINNYWNR